MARKPRIEFPGAFYRVISRGNQRQTIFHENSDYVTFLERLRLLAREMLVYLGRELSGMKTNELARLLHCDPSMISRLYRRYIENRDKEKEEKLARLLGDKVNIQA